MRALLASLLLVALSTAARAQTPTSPKADARALYDRAIVHYDLAEYDTAILEFKQAYEISREPGLLFNLAQAYRLKKEWAQALHFYETYLELKPKAGNRADAEAQIEKMKEALRAQPSPLPTAPPVVVVTTTLPLAAPVTPPPPNTRGFAHTPRGAATIALGALSGAALAASVGTGGDALSVRSRYDSGCDSGRCDHSLYQEGRSAAIATDVLLSIGVAAVVTAAIVGLAHSHPRSVGSR